jgi:signal transduction histidine kinase
MESFPPELLHLALQSADLGIWQLDLRSDEETLRSLRHDQMFGYDVLQPRWSMAIALQHVVEEDRDVFASAFRTALTAGTLQCEVRVRWPDGSIHWIAPLGRTEFSEEGQPLRMCGVVADITARRQLETQALQKSKLSAIGELTAGIAHDFNNVLQGLAGSFDLLNVFIAKGRLDECGRLASRGTELVSRAARMTHRLLAFSRRAPLNPRAVDLAQRLPAIAALMRPVAGQHSPVDVSVEAALPAVHVDDAQLEVALLNLLINARDASRGKGRIQLRARRTLHPGDLHESLPASAYRGFALIEVTDAGIGIPPDSLERVFEPFFTTKPQVAGTGLGLSQVYGYVNQSGGAIDVASVIGVGTRVRLWLPLEAGELAAVEVAAPADAVSPRSRPAVVLLVDDEPHVREPLAELLRESGHEVTAVASAAEAMTMLDSRTDWDLIVSDIGLEGPTDGCELARQCHGRLPEVPVLLITGYAGDDLDTRLPRDTTVLVKPFTGKHFARAVEGCLAATADRRPVAAD